MNESINRVANTDVPSGLHTKLDDNTIRNEDRSMSFCSYNKPLLPVQCVVGLIPSVRGTKKNSRE